VADEGAQHRGSWSKFDNDHLAQVLKANHISDQIKALKQKITLLKKKGHAKKAPHAQAGAAVHKPVA
jgi:hypothetical protein